jgi:hypothetical protein
LLAPTAKHVISAGEHEIATARARDRAGSGSARAYAAPQTATQGTSGDVANATRSAAARKVLDWKRINVLQMSKEEKFAFHTIFFTNYAVNPVDHIT